MSAAYKLAQDTEWAYARERARLKDRQTPSAQRVREEYDPHLATELAMMIESRLRVPA